MLSKGFGKKAIAVVGFALTALVPWRFTFCKPTDIGWMIALTVIGAIVYGADDSTDLGDVRRRGRLLRMEKRPPRHWNRVRHDRLCLESRIKPGGICAFSSAKQARVRAQRAAIGRCGLRHSHYASLVCAVLFAVCTVLLMFYKLNKRLTLQIADELAERRRAVATA